MIRAVICCMVVAGRNITVRLVWMSLLVISWWPQLYYY